MRENGVTVLGSYGYDGLGRRTSVTRGNGTVTSYGYDAVSRLTSLTQDLAGGGADLTVTFGYNAAGQIGYADGLNWYNYVGGDPVNFIDPSGLQECGDTVDCVVKGQKETLPHTVAPQSPGGGSEHNYDLQNDAGEMPQNDEGGDIVVTGTRLPTVDVSPQPQFFSIAGNIWDSGLPRDVDKLKSMLEDAKRAKDTQLQRRIIKQLKAADARNIGKLRGLGKFRAFPFFFFFIPDVLRIQMCSMPGNTNPTCPSGA